MNNDDYMYPKHTIPFNHNGVTYTITAVHKGREWIGSINEVSDVNAKGPTVGALIRLFIELLNKLEEGDNDGDPRTTATDRQDT